MPKIVYVPKTFKPASLEVIRQANLIIDSYRAQGYDLTLRQLYYQFVSRDLIPNKDTEYKRLGEIISDGRLAGLVDWKAIEDRTRNLVRNSHWQDPASIIRDSALDYAIDKWETQPVRVEIWVEKEALAGVVARAAERLDVPYIACRGYMSQSEMWAAAQRLSWYSERGQSTYIIHLGDHDPSGIDMSRDIADRMKTFECDVDVNRIALNMDQVTQYSPPPNPAKLTDSRVDAYIERFGDESWELDALEPSVLDQLIEDTVLAHRDEDAWDEAVAQQKDGTDLLKLASKRWANVHEFLTTSGGAS